MTTVPTVQLDANNDFITRLISNLKPDTILQSGDKQFEIHKVVLITHSSTFNGILNEKFKQDTVIEIDTDPIILGKFIDLLYFKSITVETKEFVELINLADYYNIEQIHDLLLDKRLATGTPEELFVLYKNLKNESDKKSCLKTIADNLDLKTLERLDILKLITDETDMFELVKIIVERYHSNDANKEINIYCFILAWYAFYKKISVKESLKDEKIKEELGKIEHFDDIGSEFEDDDEKEIAIKMMITIVIPKCDIYKKLLSFLDLERFSIEDLITIGEDPGSDKESLFKILSKKLKDR